MTTNGLQSLREIAPSIEKIQDLWEKTPPKKRDDKFMAQLTEWAGDVLLEIGVSDEGDTDDLTEVWIILMKSGICQHHEGADVTLVAFAEKLQADGHL